MLFATSRAVLAENSLTQTGRVCMCTAKVVSCIRQMAALIDKAPCRLERLFSSPVSVGFFWLDNASRYIPYSLLTRLNH